MYTDEWWGFVLHSLFVPLFCSRTAACNEQKMHTYIPKNNKNLNGLKNNDQIVGFLCGKAAVKKSSIQIAQ